ncbi:MAG: glutamate--cysteine ligase [Cyanobacteriota bacterium]|jgi:predicted glutamate--cysteine ligase|nr:glutamate--cysteine ligase [Cyanobacteriota bacterium]
MSGPLLTKGFEVEMYTGRPDGTVVGCAAEAAQALEGFVTEPDNRNLEYTTPPDADYQRQLAYLLGPRQQLRSWLAQRDLTLLPGSTLSLGDSSRFVRSNPDNAYHGEIERLYGTRVVTASVHINLGIQAMEPLFAGLRLLRCEGALLLALSASSPFLDGRATGAQSQRWLQFPLTPPEVPLFTSHGHYVTWMHDQLALGSMLNVRHLWTSVRPNGESRPESLNRLELRICDLISDPRLLLAVTAWAELRLLMLMGAPDRFDPLVASALSPAELARLADQNDRAAAQDGLNAMVGHWRTGEPCRVSDWLAEELAAMAPLAETLNLGATLEPLHGVLALGSESMRWLDRHRAGEPIDRIIATEAMAMEALDSALWAELSTDRAHALG